LNTSDNSPNCNPKRFRFTSNKARDRWILAFLAAAILVAFSPVYNAPYGFSEDYQILVNSSDHSGAEGMKRNLVTYISAGRVLGGLLVQLSFRFANNVVGLSGIRFLGALGVGTLACLVFVFLRYLRWGRGSAVLLATALSTLPPLLLFSSWTQEWVHPWAAVVAGLAAARLWLAMNDDGILLKRAIIQTFLLLIVAFAVHQAVASIFWFFFAIVWLSAKCADAKKNRFFFISLLTFGSAAVFNFATIRIPEILGLLQPLSRGALTNDPLEKLKWFLANPLMDASSLWWIDPITWVSICVLLAGAAGLMLMVMREHTVASAWRALVMVGILPVTYLSNLVVAENWSPYRTQLALAATILLLAAIFLRNVGALLPLKFVPRQVGLYGALALSALLMLLARQHLLEYMVLPLNREYVAVSSAIKQRYTPEVRSITIVQPNWSDSLAPKARYDEFGLPSLYADWAPGSFTKLALHDLGLAYDQMPAISWVHHDAKDIPQDTLTSAVVNAANVLRAERRVATAPSPASATAPLDPTPLGPELNQKLSKIEKAYLKFKHDTGRDTNQIADLVKNYSGFPKWKGPYLPSEKLTDTVRTNLADQNFSTFGLQALQRSEGALSAGACGGDLWKKEPMAPLNIERCAVYVVVGPVPAGDMAYLNNQIDKTGYHPGVDDKEGRLRIVQAGSVIYYQLP
jgi:hypothetical protein